MRKGEPTPDEMFQAVSELGEALRQPGDNQKALIGRIVSESGLSERAVRAYFHREARRNHMAHLDLFQELTSRAALENAPAPIQTLFAKLQRDIFEAHERIHRLEHTARRNIAERDRGHADLPRSFNRPVAG
ncbi:hypothetical protein AB1P65_09375 [Roseibium alexandrii]